MIALRDRGFPVEYILAPDEGHGFQRPVNSMSLWAASERFFAKHLGGRFQAELTPELTKRLAEITVDPKTVVLSKAVDTASVGVPKVAFPWSAGKASYAGKIEVGGQTIPLSTTQTIEEQGGNWVVTGTAKMPMGDAVDITTLDKATLVPRKRSIKQGPAAIELAFADGKATGTVAMGGEPKPVSVELGGELFADGVGSNEALASLPLAEGFGTTYRNFDVRQQKVQLKQAKVDGRGERDRARRDLRGLEGRDHLGRGRARPDDDLGRQGLAQGREGERDAARRWAAPWSRPSCSNSGGSGGRDAPECSSARRPPSRVLSLSPDRELPPREQLLGIDLARQAEQNRLHQVAALVADAELAEPPLEPGRGGLVHRDERRLGRLLDRSR